jgi:hypothetical protein
VALLAALSGVARTELIALETWPTDNEISKLITQKVEN